MYFLVEYDRETKTLKQCTAYHDKEKAWQDRFDLESKLTQEGKLWTEAVVFEADTKQDLEHNHSRYFNQYKDVFRKLSKFDSKYLVK